MRYLTTKGGSPPVSFTTALFDGLAPDGGLYVPETIEPWHPDEIARLPRRTLTEIGLRALITEAGDVCDVCLTRATGAGLDDEVVQAVRQWKYSPVLLNGTPVKSGTTISVKFGFERL